jgi:RNA polymerase sigma factor (sigma-70 family)
MAAAPLKKVLVVDDEETITDGLVTLFDIENIPADGVYDRESAERLIAQDYYPVVIADLRLRTEDEGLRLIETIRKKSPVTQIASLTAYATPKMERELLDLGACVVLHKPMEFDSIIEVVVEMLLELDRRALESGQPFDHEKLYEYVSKLLFSIPQRRFGFPPDEANDLVQKAWLLFLEKRESIQLPRQWLAGTIVNLCRQEVKLRVSERARRATLGERPVRAMEFHRTDDTDMLVREALGRIDKRARRLLELIGMEGWTYEEVSVELGISLGSVGPLYIRAKNRMKKVMA